MTTGFSGTTYTGGNQPTLVERAYVDGYKAGRIAALREVGCRWISACKVMTTPEHYCKACRLLAEAESGEDTGGQ